MYEFKNTALPPQRPTACDSGSRILGRDARLFALDDDQLDAWQERVAICTVDGGLSEVEAEAIAWQQIDAAQAAHVGAGAGVGARGEERAQG